MKRRNFFAILTAAAAAAICWTSCGGYYSGGSSSSAGYYQNAGTAYDGAAAGTAMEGMPEPDWNTEEYNRIVENRFRAVKNAPLSTFAADVDTASYTNLRRKILAGEDVPEDAVRIEEMVNYFRYNYPEPAGDEPFSVSTEIAPCPWNEQTKLLRVGLQAPQPDWEAMPPSNLVFLIDVSGSMDGWDRLPLVKQAFLFLTEHLRSEDRISIVTYANEDTVVLDGASGEDGETIQQAIEGLYPNGGTNGSQGLLRAYEIARKNFIPEGNNRIILATDGDLNIGPSSEGELSRLVKREKKEGIFLSVMGFGAGNTKDNKMEAMADDGDGNYSYIDSVLEAKRVLVEEMGGTLFTVAKDVKLQVEFNPAQVKGYRLIGYENRLMDAEDFDDDEKDGGEIGAGHRVTALYEVVPVDSEFPIEGADLKYQDSTANNSPEWLTVSIRYKEPDGKESRLLEYPVGPEAIVDAPSADTALAACVAQFGMLLRQSEYLGTATYESLEEELKALPGLNDDPYQTELLYLVQRAAKLQ